jgi:hypothetical protein
MADIPSVTDQSELEMEKQFAAVKYAYDFALPSYQWAILRFEAAVTRIHGLMMFAATMTLGAPVIGRALSDQVRFSSVWFIMALVLFVVLMILGLIAREYGTLRLVGPSVLYEKVLDLSEREFKRYVVYYAGQHFEHNRSLIEKKSLAAMIMAVQLFAETLAIVIWLITAVPRSTDMAL